VGVEGASPSRIITKRAKGGEGHNLLERHNVLHARLQACGESNRLNRLRADAGQSGLHNSCKFGG